MLINSTTSLQPLLVNRSLSLMVALFWPMNVLPELLPTHFHYYFFISYGFPLSSVLGFYIYSQENSLFKSSNGEKSPYGVRYKG